MLLFEVFCFVFFPDLAAQELSFLKARETCKAVKKVGLMVTLNKNRAVSGAAFSWD